LSFKEVLALNKKSLNAVAFVILFLAVAALFSKYSFAFTIEDNFVNNTGPARGEVVNFAVLISTPPNVMGVSFQWNATGSFIIISNKLYYNLTTAEDKVNSSVNLSITALPTSRIGWQYIANASDGTLITYPNPPLTSTILTVMNIPPTIPVIIFPSNKLNTSKNSVDLNVTFPAEVENDTISISYYINGKFNQTIGKNMTVNASDGNYTAIVNSFDGFNFSGNSSVNFTVDTIAPKILSFNNILNNSNISKIISLNASASDDGTGISNLVFRIGNQTISAIKNFNITYTSGFDTKNLPDGIYNLTAAAQDFAANNDSAFLTLTIDNNEFPNLTQPLPGIKFNEDEFNQSLNLSQYFIDIDNATLIYSYSSNDSNVFVTFFLNNTAKFNASLNWNGAANITITASDGKHSASGNITVNVTAANDAPVLFLSNIIVNESDVANINASGNINATDVEEDGMNFTYSSPLNSSGRWQTNFTDARNYTVTVTANDGNSGTASKSATITVLDKPNGADDTVIGDTGDIISTLNVTLKINNSLFNSSRALTGINHLNFSGGNFTIFDFDFNFTNATKFSFLSIRINSTFINGSQGIIINGIDLASQGRTKTVYLNRTNATFNSVCIKDAEISSITEVSGGCASGDETKLASDGIATSGFTCALEGNNYKITGMRHSGIKQINYARPSSPSGSSPSGDGGGSSSGSGNSLICSMGWSCSAWSECISGKKSRECSFAEVQQRFQNEPCPDASKKPAASMDCPSKEAIKPRQGTNNAGYIPKARNPAGKTGSQNEKTANDTPFSSITGSVIAAVNKISANPKAAREVKIYTIGIISILVLAAGYKKIKAGKPAKRKRRKSKHKKRK